jgi:hypothetical protein
VLLCSIVMLPGSLVVWLCSIITPPGSPGIMQLAALGTKERARLGWPFLAGEKKILKTMMFRDVRAVLNERKHLKMVIRSVPDSVSLILGRTE